LNSTSVSLVFHFVSAFTFHFTSFHSIRFYVDWTRRDVLHRSISNFFSIDLSVPVVQLGTCTYSISESDRSTEVRFLMLDDPKNRAMQRQHGSVVGLTLTATKKHRQNFSLAKESHYAHLGRPAHDANKRTVALLVCSGVLNTCQANFVSGL